jgi:hypothetical protein
MRPNPRSMLIPIAALMLTACGAQRVVFSPTPEQRMLLGAPPLPFDLVVVHWPPRTPGKPNAKAYGTTTAKLLQRSGAFRSVTYDSLRTTRGDLYAESRGDYCNTAIIPIATLLTLGLWPTIWNETECTGVVFRRPDGQSTDSVVVHVKASSKAVMGWAALPLLALPGWTFHSGRNQGAYHDLFRLAIIEKQDELARLAR